MKQFLKIFSSLRLTLWLLGFSVLLVFLGSLAQVPEGLWNAQVRWFKEWIVIRREGDAWFVPPIFPGGHLLGILLLVNLLAAHFKRFQWSFQKFGIQLTHFGIIVMLIGQFITDETSVESAMQFQEGEARNFTEHHRDTELVFIRTADGVPENDEVISIPQAALERNAELKHEKLPCSVKIHSFGLNASLLELSDLPEVAQRLRSAVGTLDGKFASTEGIVAIAEADSKNVERLVVWRKALKKIGENNDDIIAATKRVARNPAQAKELMASVKSQFREDMLAAFKQLGDQEQRFFSPRIGSEMGYVAELEQAGRLGDVEQAKGSSSQGSGKSLHVLPRLEVKDDKQGHNYHFAVIELLEGGASRGTWLLSSRLKEQEIEIGGKPWRVSLRSKRYYLPFALQLERAKQEVYQGTSHAKEYASRVRIINAAANENRQTDVTMNNPLRYGGLTFYQSTMNQMDKGPGTAALLEALTGRPRAEFADMEEKEGGRSSGFQVVGNPSMLAPYTGCLLVGFGMLWQFLFHLTNFLAKRAGLPPPSFGVPHALLPACAVAIMIPDVFLAWVAIKNGTFFALAVVAVTPIIRGVLAWQVWRGRYLVFAMVLLLIPTLLAIPFALKYHESHGALLWPVSIAQLIAFLGIAFVVFTNRPKVTL